MTKQLPGRGGFIKPKRMRQDTIADMERIVEHLYYMRVATAKQIAQIVDLREPDLRLKIDRYQYITKRHRQTVQYDDGEWVTASRVNVYTLSQDVVWELERQREIAYYRSYPDKEPEPDVSVVSRFIQLSEIYTRMATHGMLQEGLLWIPAVWFQAELARRRGASEAINKLPIPNGIKWEDHLYGASLYDGEQMSGFKRFIGRVIPKGQEWDSISGHYRAVIFVTNHRSGDATLHCTRDFMQYGGAIIWSYEWSIENPLAVIYGLKEQRERILHGFFEARKRRGCVIRPVTRCPYNWLVTNSNGEEEYVDTSIGNNVSNVWQMLTDNSLGGAKRRLLVATDEERVTFDQVRKVNANVEVLTPNSIV